MRITLNLGRFRSFKGVSEGIILKITFSYVQMWARTKQKIPERGNSCESTLILNVIIPFNNISAVPSGRNCAKTEAGFNSKYCNLQLLFD